MSIPYKGFIEVRLKLLNSQIGEEVLVPLLVASDHLDHPIIGYNVDKTNNIISSMAASFPTVDSKNIKTLVELIKTNECSELCLVKTIKHDVLIPQGKTVSVTCRANTRSNAASKLPVLFEPDPEQPMAHRS